ncbi:MAG: preprotein translocase subunit SecG [Ectothiorhodospiraceae bacterium]|nr:preprotein translocase subunit SecG [Ectothiorhodospiraceae bacterium]
MALFIVILVLILVVGVLMTASILLQNPKGGGLSGAFGGAGASVGTMLGVRHASDVLQKATWWLAGIFAGLIFIVNMFFLPTAGEVQESAIERAAQEQPLSPVPQQAPQSAPAPGTQPGTPGGGTPAQQGAPQQGGQQPPQ